MELGVLGPLQVRQYGLPVAIPGAKPRAILTMLGLHGGSVVSADTLAELLWGDDPPRTAAKALQTHISSLRRTLGDGFVLTQGTGWTLSTTEIDASRYRLAAKTGREAIAAGDTSQAVARFDDAVTLWRGVPELPDSPRGTSEKTRWIEGHAALVEDRADAQLATGRAAEIIGELEAAIGDAPLRERRWGQLMLALYRAGRQGEALAAYQRARSLLADELGVDPGPDLRRLEAAIVAQDEALEVPAAQHFSSVTRAVTFLLTDIEGSTAAWEADANAMAVALARHDELVEQVVTSRGGRLIKTRGEGDATFSVFDRPSAAAAAAIELQEAIAHEPWKLLEPLRIRVALHTGEVELRDGDYFGRAVNRAARLRSIGQGGQTLCSGATAELVIDSLPDDVLLIDLGTRQLKNLARPEHVFELRLETADDSHAPTTEMPMERPDLPAVLTGAGPFVGRGRELERLLSVWQTTLDAGTRAVLIAGEPGVGKTRLAGEWSRRAYQLGGVVLYGRCDEDLGAPYQPFAEALRSLVPCVGAKRLRGLRGVEALLPLIPGLIDVLPDLAAPPRADPDTERYALFDAVVALLGVASTSAPIVLILDDLHWAAKPTLLLLRHLLRFGEHARVQIVGTYRSTDLDRSHPLAAMLADLHRDGSAHRLALGGLDEDDVTAYVTEAGYDDEELARALASVTGGNPFFLIEALRHVDESGGRWDPSTLPQGVREAVSRRLSRLPTETNKALAAAAVVGSRFALELVERVVDGDLVDAFDEACKAGIVIEEPGGRYRFNHAIVRQSLLAELPSVRRMRLHQRIAATLEIEQGVDDELLAELAYHYFECAWAGNAAKAVEYCRRAADQAMARLAYEGAADLYDKALHALEELDEELPDRDDRQAELLVARCEALLAAGDVASAAGAVSQLQDAAGDSARLAAWGTCFDGQLSMLTHPERLDEIESAVAAAAEKLAGLDDAAGEAKAHTVRAGCLARLGRIGDAETALDQALTAARRAHEHRRVNNVLANAPLAALWGPNPVPRAGGRCLDVVRLLRITTGSPVVEATSTRCQGVLDAFRGRAAAGRQLIDSARRTITELGMRHALLEVEHFAGIVELVADDPAAAEQHLRRAYNGFRRMGLDADTAETAALLARACLAVDRDAEAAELCTESERLAGHALKASIAWRTVRAQLLARGGDHDEARRVAEEAVAVAERTDLLVDHGDACLALATVLGIAGDAAGARAAAERAVGLYEQKGAAALAEKARSLLEHRDESAGQAPTEPPIIEPDTACVRVARQLEAAIQREAWDEFAALYATDVVIESRRKVVGFTRDDPQSADWPGQVRELVAVGARHRMTVIAVRGEQLALARLEVATADVSPGAPRDESLQLLGLDSEGRMALLVFFDVEDIEAAIAELDAAHVRLENESPRTPLVNAATRADDRLNALFTDRRWDEIGELFADHVRLEDRRRGLRNETEGRATAVAAVRAIADTGTKSLTSDVIAIRGERLALVRTLHQGRDTRHDAFATETLVITEVDADGLMVATIAFEPNEFEAAIRELDARYLAGEAGAHTRTWSVIAAGYAALNRHELPATTPDFVSIDHRRGTAFAPGELIEYARAGLGGDQNIRTYVETVHRLSDLGTVFTHVGHETSKEGFDAEWRIAFLCTVQGDMVNRCEMFDEADVDAAIAKFDQLSQPVQRLENAATRVFGRFPAYFSTRDWDAIADVVAQDFFIDDRRRTVNAGIRDGRNAGIEDLQAAADVGLTDMTFEPIAIRGERLALTRLRMWLRDERPDAFGDVLQMIEIDADEKLAAIIVFDLDDIDAAFEELDAHYLAGEAAAYAHTWSFIAHAYTSFNRRELFPTTPDWVSIDHRRGTTVAPGDLKAFISASWADTPDSRIYIEAVHRLSDFGAVATSASHGSSQEGFEAEWREIAVTTVDGEMIRRTELFDEEDLEAALARFEELHPQPRRLENAASQRFERLFAHFAARDWDAMAEDLAAEYFQDDRRRVVTAGIRRGRDAEIESFRSAADLGLTHVTSAVVATRGQCLSLAHARFWGRDQGPEAFLGEGLFVVEINADNRIAAGITFDVDDIDAAVEELDTRYSAGEAAAHARTWSVIAQAYAAANRHELPATTPDFVNVDHRSVVTIESGDLIPYLRDTFETLTEISTYVEAVHRLTDLGAVGTHVGIGTSQDGFEAEWRVINVGTVDGDLISRVECFAESDLDAALARFDELNGQTRRLENAASQVADRFLERFAAGDWDAMAQMVINDISFDDRRRVVNADLQIGRDQFIENFRVAADFGATQRLRAIATRGDRIVLARARFSRSDGSPEEFGLDLLHVIEIDADNRIAATVTFDPDDLDAAFEELDARYVAGEAMPYSRTWSAIAGAFVAHNRGEVAATTPDAASIDHRRGAAFAPGEGEEYLRAGWDLDQSLNIYIETVQRVSERGAVFTWIGHGTSHQGFAAEWRGVNLMMVDGELLSRAEVFDEEDVDDAIARFERLSQPAPLLENAATQTYERCNAYFVARDWDALAAMLSDDVTSDDRRRVVRAGIQHGRETVIETVRAIADLGMTNLETTTIASRGRSLSLSRARYTGRDQGTDAFRTDILQLVEIDADNRMVASIVFDPNEIDVAFEELDIRYVAGEAAANSQVWSVISRAYTTMNRREFPATTPDWVNIDHRRVATIAPGELSEHTHASWDLAPDLRVYVEKVHRLSRFGAVVTNSSYGTSREGFDAEWRMIQLITVDGDRISRCEIFDEADLDAALERFDELDRSAPRLENAATRTWLRLAEAFNRRDVGGLLALVALDGQLIDRRKGLGALHVGSERLDAARALLDVPDSWRTNVEFVAIRGSRLALVHQTYRDSDDVEQPITIQLLTIVEVSEAGLVGDVVNLDIDNIDAAFEELDARYLAGEAAPHADTWSAVIGSYAALNRHEHPATTPDWVNTDNRRTIAFAPGNMSVYIHASLDDAADFRVYVEAVYQLSDLGAVVTQAAYGTSQQGFDAEWRMINLLTFDGDLINRSEMFDETDIDTALARFDELSHPAPRLENAASRMFHRFNAYLAARDWDAMAQMMTDDVCDDDRRRVVSGGIRRGRGAQLQNLRAIVGVGVKNYEATVIATRGERLVLTRSRVSGGGQPDEAFALEMLSLIEIDTNHRISAGVSFDLDNVDAAFEELDARYVAGDAAAYARTWSLIAKGYAAINRREVPSITGQVIDRRRLAPVEGLDLTAYIEATLDLARDITVYIEAVHRLTDRAAVVTHVASATAQDGVDAEWRVVDVYTIEGDVIDRCEMFDDTDLDTALARFDELNSPASQLENAAIRTWTQIVGAINRRDVDDFLALASPDSQVKDRRKGLRAFHEGPERRKAAEAMCRAPAGWRMEVEPVAIRGDRLGLTRERWRDTDETERPITVESLTLTEVTPDKLVRYTEVFDPDDVNGAIGELTARWIASGEVAHPDVIEAGLRLHEAGNRHDWDEIATHLADASYVNHRELGIEGADTADYLTSIRMFASLVPNLRSEAAEVLAYSAKGLVAYMVLKGTSTDGVAIEIPHIHLALLDGDRVTHFETFDPEQLDQALARFDELNLA
ncbi:MAG TPA: BTAD domain-containing putative transcriptional regulator [Mycobacterium sp.]|nr:BTAD domain-containing putative transcriptional regulator [Mycobacterium sp.]